MHIVFLINNLGIGGAERVVQRMADYLVDKHKVTVILLAGSNRAYTLDKRVNVVTLRSSLIYKMPLNTVLMPLQAIELAHVLKGLRPDATLSFLVRANLVHLMTSFFGNKSSIFISEHNMSIKQFSSNSLKHRLMNRLIRDLYSQASAIFVVSNGVGESLQTDYHIDQHLIRTVYNPIGIADIIKKSHKKVEFPQIASGFKIVTLGRLTPQKDHSTLLRAFAQVKKNVYNAELIIIGEGSLLGELKRLSDELGIGECVWFAGWQENPFTIMSRCNLFVLSSKFEGFGNVIVEAMACGLPIISTDCQSGPAEILNHGEYGILTPVGDATALGNAIERLIKDRKLHAHYKRMSLKRSKDFDTPLIASKLIDFLIQRDHK